MVSLGLTYQQATNAAYTLLRKRYLVICDHVTYRLSPEGEAAAAAGEVFRNGLVGRVKPVPGTTRERAWRAMRIRRTFTLGDLVSDAANPGEGQPRDNIGRCLLKLEQAGYVRALPPRAGAGRSKRYVLMNNTGPKAPIFRSEMGVVFDQNLGENVPCTQA